MEIVPISGLYLSRNLLSYYFQETEFSEETVASAQAQETAEPELAVAAITMEEVEEINIKSAN